MRELLLILAQSAVIAGASPTSGAETAAPRDVAAVELRVPMPAGHSIAAVLETAAPAERRPTVLLIAGAGPLDRNGYTMRSGRAHNDAFRTIARRLVAQGYAVLRFDKVGTGRSTGSYRARATTATLAEDVRGLVAALRARPEVDPARVHLVGHSEGGAIAGIVAAEDPLIAGVALLAAPAWSGRRIMSYQVRLAAEHQSRRLSYTSADFIEARMAGDLRDRLTSEAWYPFFLDYDPLPPMRRLTMPVLVLQGEQDAAVLFEQAYELAEAVRANGNPRVTLTLLPGYGHALSSPREIPPRGAPAPIADEVLRHLEGWLAGLER